MRIDLFTSELGSNVETATKGHPLSVRMTTIPSIFLQNLFI